MRVALDDQGTQHVSHRRKRGDGLARDGIRAAALGDPLDDALALVRVRGLESHRLLYVADRSERYRTPVSRVAGV